MTASYKSLDASRGSVFLNLRGTAKGALIRAAASTQTFDGYHLFQHANHQHARRKHGGAAPNFATAELAFHTVSNNPSHEAFGTLTALSAIHTELCRWKWRYSAQRPKASVGLLRLFATTR